MTHRQKQRLARRNRTKTEINSSPKIAIFETAFWEKRTEKIRTRILQTEENRRLAKESKKNLKVA